jgi:uncharacterized protein (DUF983 family)
VVPRHRLVDTAPRAPADTQPGADQRAPTGAATPQRRGLNDTRCPHCGETRLIEALEDPREGATWRCDVCAKTFIQEAP